MKEGEKECSGSRRLNAGEMGPSFFHSGLESGDGGLTVFDLREHHFSGWFAILINPLWMKL